MRDGWVVDWGLEIPSTLSTFPEKKQQAAAEEGRKEGRRMKEMVAKRWRGGKGQLQLGVIQP
jgi:hypothetical protein